MTADIIQPTCNRADRCPSSLDRGRETASNDTASHDNGSLCSAFRVLMAWALVDHEFSRISSSPTRPRRAGVFVADLFITSQASRPRTLRERNFGLWLDHPRSGDLVLVSGAQQLAGLLLLARRCRRPGLCPHGVDIHRKPGYDPVELFFDPATPEFRSTRGWSAGSHGHSASDNSQRGVIVASEPGVLVGQALADTDVYDLVLRQFGI